MKHLLLICFFSVASLAFLPSCEKDDPQPEPRQADALVLTEKSAKILDLILWYMRSACVPVVTIL